MPCSHGRSFRAHNSEAIAVEREQKVAKYRDSQSVSPAFHIYLVGGCVQVLGELVSGRGRVSVG